MRTWVCYSDMCSWCCERVLQVSLLLTESRRMLRNVLLNRMENWVMQLAEKLWQPSDDKVSWETKTASIVSHHPVSADSWPFYITAESMWWRPLICHILNSLNQLKTDISVCLFLNKPCIKLIFTLSWHISICWYEITSRISFTLPKKLHQTDFNTFFDCLVDLQKIKSDLFQAKMSNIPWWKLLLCFISQ